MPAARCPHCDAHFHVKLEAIGKRARCRKCSQTFSVVAEDREALLTVEPLAGLASGRALAGAPAPRANTPAVESPDNMPAIPFPDALRGPPPNPGEAGGFRAFLGCIGRALHLFSSLGNVVMFVIMWVIIGADLFLSFAPLFSFLGTLLINGCYFAFLFGVLEAAAGGEDTLPEISVEQNWFLDLASALAKFILVRLLCTLPAALCAFYLLFLQIFDGADTATAIVLSVAASVEGLLQFPPPYGHIMLACLFAGLSFEPIMLLIVVIGGLPGLARPDLAVMTIVRTPMTYGIVVVCYIASWLGPGLVADVILPEDTSLSGRFGPLMLLLGVSLYCTVAATRLIGFYYHTMKRWFAWDWG